MANTQYNLNGGLYAPPIQPPIKTYHSHGRRGGNGGCGICSCCLDCLVCCGGCLLGIICNILIGIAVFLGIVALILWFIFRPNVVKFQVVETNLTRFELDPQSNNLHYNLSMNFSIRNPNQRLGIHYDQLEARGYYDDQRFAAVNMTSFYQGHKNSTVVGTEMNGQSLVLLGHGGRRDLREDQKSGVYRIDVKLRFKIRFKFGFLNSWAFRPKIKCHLKVPLNSSTAGGFQFHPTKCHFLLFSALFGCGFRLDRFSFPTSVGSSVPLIGKINSVSTEAFPSDLRKNQDLAVAIKKILPLLLVLVLHGWELNLPKIPDVEPQRRRWVIGLV
ncbi:hypothetical protein AALP_AA4G126100 [Arabis alpina]|uniref:Late embryogenesis abundant protein LEA-2 subgroup domain-containing protein n=1 Tax=Arabis alpina TaxID=50452 RepID=A0A087H2U9_ARAAL|nr:hypothetical protein AALP_AA4G126100 [Arabis alpina]